ncbi:hypothetical protein FNV43_RR16977 [Rhamnella rubrinervis]|uniref:Uncharacterized protein n=1 Tax=Rhamnella rubrinervis TaxID=2594499 RepID=A0A8K0GZR6_9ROSA|nr:hypothetical protein FNV43_RR16977 [Rhamnella rubrinervis]
MGISIITAVGIGRLVSQRLSSRAWQSVDWRTQQCTMFFAFCRLSDWVLGRCDPPVEELVMPDSYGIVTRWGQLDVQGFGGPPDAEEDPKEVVAEDSMSSDDYIPWGYTPDAEEDPKEVVAEDSMSSDDYIPWGYTPEPVDLEDFDPCHPEPESSSGDATSRLVEAIERLVAQNVQHQQQQPQQPAGINVVVKRFRDLHPLEFDGLSNPLEAENWIRGSQSLVGYDKRAYHIDEHPMMSALFKTLFYEKYFPQVKRDEKETEFINIEERKARHFEKGLRPELYNAIAMFQFPLYSKLL